MNYSLILPYLLLTSHRQTFPFFYTNCGWPKGVMPWAFPVIPESKSQGQNHPTGEQGVEFDRQQETAEFDKERQESRDELGKIRKEWTKIRDEWVKILAEEELNREKTKRVEKHKEIVLVAIRQAIDEERQSAEKE